jgi:SAM-dependent methyltransferase
VTYETQDLNAMTAARNYHRWIMGAFRPYVGNAVAEVGAGTGDFSRLILEAGCERFIAIEPSVNLVPSLQRQFNGSPRVEVLGGYLKDHLPHLKGQVDTLFYINVLEHVPVDKEELALVHQALAPGGYVCIFVPALPWLYSEFDQSVGHYRRYLKGDLIRMVQQSGLEVVRARYFDVLGILPWLISMKLLKGDLDPAKVALYDRFVVPVARRLERILPVPVGKNLLLLARKPRYVHD